MNSSCVYSLFYVLYVIPWGYKGYFVYTTVFLTCYIFQRKRTYHDKNMAYYDESAWIFVFCILCIRQSLSEIFRFRISDKKLCLSFMKSDETLIDIFKIVQGHLHV